MSSTNFLAIFDHDGVLIDSLLLHQNAWMDLGRRQGLPITEELIDRTFGMTNPAILRELCGESIDDHEVHRLGSLKEECYRATARGRVALMAGVADLLKALEVAGFLLAVGTSGPRADIDLTIEENKLEGRFRAIAALEDISRSKPDPEVFLLAAARGGVDPSRCVVFEDATVGLRAAKAAGMWAVGVTTTRPATMLWEAGADQVVESLARFDVGELAARLATR